MSDDVKPLTREELDALVLQIKEIGTDGIEQEWMRRPASDASPHWLDRLLATARARLQAAEDVKRLRAALEQIAEGRGRYSRDELKFAQNVIAAARATACEALGVPNEPSSSDTARSVVPATEGEGGPSSVSRTPAQANVTDLAIRDRRPASDASAHAARSPGSSETATLDDEAFVANSELSRAVTLYHELDEQVKRHGMTRASLIRALFDDLLKGRERSVDAEGPRDEVLIKALNLLSTFRDHGALCGDVLVLADVEEIDAFLAEVSRTRSGRASSSDGFAKPASTAEREELADDLKRNGLTHDEAREVAGLTPEDKP